VFPVWDHTLPSGLRLVVENDDVSKQASLVAIVDVGQVDNPSGKGQLAHVIEHLAFRAPDASGTSTWDRLLRMGAVFNAETSPERTSYYAEVPASALDVLVAAVLERLDDPTAGATEGMLAKEVSTVSEELNRRGESIGFLQLIAALLPPDHPYVRASAEARQIGNITLDDARAFADRYYEPERMTIVISGPVTAEWEENLRRKMPANLRGQTGDHRNPVRKSAISFAQPTGAPSELAPVAANVGSPELWIGWRLPPAAGETAMEMEVIASTVRATLLSRMDPDGVNDVIDVDVGLRPGSLSSELICRLVLRSAADAARIRDDSLRQVEALGDLTLVSVTGLKWDYSLALQNAFLTTALKLEGILERSRVRAEMVHSGDSPMLSALLDKLGKIDLEAVSAFAGRYLTPNAARTVLLTPRDPASRRRVGPRRDQGDISIGSTVPVESTPESDATVAQPASGDLRAVDSAPGARGAIVRRLSNGLTIIALRRAGLPFVSMNLGFHADPQPGDRPLARDAYLHAIRFHLSEAPSQRGLLRFTWLTPDSIQETLGMFSDKTREALDFLFETGDTAYVSLPRSDFGLWAEKQARWQGTPEGRSLLAFSAALFGDHPYHMAPPASVARQVKESDIEAWIGRVRRPANGALAIVGDIDPEAVIRDAEHALAGWKGKPGEPPAAPAPLAPRREIPTAVPVKFTTDAGRSAGDIRFGCVLPPVMSYRDAIGNELLADVIESDIFTRLRWKEGESYSPEVSGQALRGGTAWLEGRLDVQGPAISRALDALRSWLAVGGTARIDQTKFDELRFAAVRRNRLTNETSSRLAGSLVRAWNMGWSPGVLDEYSQNLASLTLADMEERLRVCRASATVEVLSAGGP
jgi:predicted Zn-dependent peptidase